MLNIIKNDLWEEPCDALCITTNGTVKKGGHAVMGRGCALEAKRKIEGIAHTLGQRIQSKGNRVDIIGMKGDKILFRFPVKHEWWEKADIDLITKSMTELLLAIKHHKLNKVLLPLPGCGNGGLDWEREVKPQIELLYAKYEKEIFNKVYFIHK